MSRTQLLWHITAVPIIGALLVWSAVRLSAQPSRDDYPQRPIQVVVPYAAGGGSDTFVRIMQRGIAEERLLGQPLVIINQPGGSGTIGSRDVKDADPNGYRILCHHNAIITAKLAGTVSYGREAFEPIAMTGEMSMVILVRGDSPLETVADLLEQAKLNPNSIRFGANKGAPAYFTTLQLENAWPGAQLSIVSSGGGADRYSKILGGHLEAGIFSLSEYLDFRGVAGTTPAQDVRAIAVLSAQRHAAIREVPTATEMGVPVVLSNANYWWAPKGTPKPIVDKLARVLQRAMQNETVLGQLDRLRMDPTFDRGPSLQRRLAETSGRFEAVRAHRQAVLPNFTLYVGVIVAVLFVGVVVQSYRETSTASVTMRDSDFSRRPGIAAACFIALCGYVLLLAQGGLPFAVVTAAMVLVVGGLMFRGGRGNWVLLVELAMLTAMGSQFVFTEIFTAALP